MSRPWAFEDVCEALKGQDQGNRAAGVQILESVVFNPEVKSLLLRNTSRTESGEAVGVLRDLAKVCVDRNAQAQRLHWETLAIIGELCRREHKEDVANHEGHNELQVQLSESFVSIPWFRSALEDLSREGTDDIRAMAEDLLGSLPFSGWTQDRRERCKDLMYLDPTCVNRAAPPLLARSSKFRCTNCQKTSQTPLSKCSRCQAASYCGQECQVSHWKSSHKAPCNSVCGKPNPEVRALTALYFPTRAMVYQARPENLQGVRFDKFFMEYSPLAML